MKYMIKVKGSITASTETVYTIEAESESEAIEKFTKKYSDSEIQQDLIDSLDCDVANGNCNFDIDRTLISKGVETTKEDGTPCTTYSDWNDFDY